MTTKKAKRRKATKARISKSDVRHEAFLTAIRLVDETLQYAPEIIEAADRIRAFASAARSLRTLLLAVSEKDRTKGEPAMYELTIENEVARRRRAVAKPRRKRKEKP